MENINVNKDACISCGACQSIAPDTFELNEDGVAEAKNQTITEDAIEAKNCCPTSAIEINEN